MARQGRTPEQLQGWADLLELCQDECQVFDTSPSMRTAVLEVERELSRLHAVEKLCVRLARASSDQSVRLACADLIPGSIDG